MELKCAVQNYHWGKLGAESEVALLAAGSQTGFEIEPSKRYAELWMGTHPSGPSVIASTGEKLADWITAHPDSLGEEVIKKFGIQIPYLFKVLSVNQALSIQAHPNKKYAEVLHKEKPELYKDPNHKPEMAIALTTFEALCGFRPVAQISHFLQSIAELRELVGEENVSCLVSSDEAGIRSAMQKCFTSLMSCPKQKVIDQFNTFLERLRTMDESSRTDHEGSLFERLSRQYPGDVGCFGIYFFNIVILQPGEAMYLDANEPHAYLSGDCIECMACSDNVVRAGLTPKYVDVETLCTMLTYNCEPAETKRFEGNVEDACTTLFRPPVPDFAVAKIVIPMETPSYSLIPRNGPTIFIVVRGEATGGNVQLRRGSVVFLPAKQTVTITPKDSSPLLLFQALSNV